MMSTLERFLMKTHFKIMNYEKFNALIELIQDGEIQGIADLRTTLEEEKDYWGEVSLADMEAIYEIAESGDFPHHCPECYRALPQGYLDKLDENHYQLTTDCKCGITYYG